MDAPNGEVVTLSAADPLNLAGILVPGEKTPAFAGRFVSFRDGAAMDGVAMLRDQDAIARAG
jgi:hypothetical protein